MINQIKKFLKDKLSLTFPNRYFARNSYSQEGEDMLLRKFIDNDGIKNGFYVDIGAHHPMRFSNTYYFYRKGWNGINIDAMPGSMSLFNKTRKRDINLEIGISKEKQTLKYYIFDEPAINGFEKELSNERGETTNKIIEIKEVQTLPLGDVLDKYLPKDKQITFFSIDVEGLDFEVLKSNDWGKYKPKYILMEALGNDPEQIYKSEVYLYLKKLGYSFVAKTLNTCLFKLD